MVSFDMSIGKKGLKAINVTILNAQTLANEIDFADEADYKNFRNNILSAKGAAFVNEFIVAVSAETLKKFANSFTAEDLCKKILLLESEHSATELAMSLEEILDAEKFFATVKLCAAQSSNQKNCSAVVRQILVKYFDALPVDKLADMVKNLSPTEILDAVKDKPTFREKFSELMLPGVFLLRGGHLESQRHQLLSET